MKHPLATGLIVAGLGLAALAAVIVTPEPRPAPRVPYLVVVGLDCDGEPVRLYAATDDGERDAKAACASIEIHAAPQAER